MEKPKKALTFPLQIAGALILLSLIGYMQHWPYTDILMFTTLGAVMVMYSIRFAKKPQKKAIDYVKLVFVLAWCGNAFFTILHWPAQIFLQGTAASTFLLWLLLEGLESAGRKSPLKDKLAPALLGTAIIMVFAGAFLKIMHWSGAPELLIIGLLLGTIWFVRDTFFLEKKEEEENP